MGKSEGNGGYKTRKFIRVRFFFPQSSDGSRICIVRDRKRRKRKICD